MYRNDTTQGGRPNTNEVVVKLLVLQQWYSLSDTAEEIGLGQDQLPALPRLPRAATRLLNGLAVPGAPRRHPDRRAGLGGAAEAARREGAPRQEGGRPGCVVYRGGPGSIGQVTRDEAATRRSQDSDWAKREKLSVFGYKLHVKTDLNHGLVRAVEAPPASARALGAWAIDPGLEEAGRDSRVAVLACFDMGLGRVYVVLGC
jgi:hypothetical protein